MINEVLVDLLSNKITDITKKSSADLHRNHEMDHFLLRQGPVSEEVIIFCLPTNRDTHAFCIKCFPFRPLLGLFFIYSAEVRFCKFLNSKCWERLSRKLKKHNPFKVVVS